MEKISTLEITFQNETHDTLWKAYITKNGRTIEIPENNHIEVFNYANA